MSNTPDQMLKYVNSLMAEFELRNRSDHKLIFRASLPEFGVQTKEVYDALNAAAAPQKVLLFAAFDKVDEIYHKPRLSGGRFYLQLVPGYGRDMNPYQMIENKLAFKAQKRANRQHNSQVLATMVAKLLYRKSPETFRALTQELILTMPQSTPFWGGLPTTAEQQKQLYRYYEVGGPNYRPTPAPFHLKMDQQNMLSHIISKANDG